MWKLTVRVTAVVRSRCFHSFCVCQKSIHPVLIDVLLDSTNLNRSAIGIIQIHTNGCHISQRAMDSALVSFNDVISDWQRGIDFKPAIISNVSPLIEFQYTFVKGEDRLIRATWMCSIVARVGDYALHSQHQLDPVSPCVVLLRATFLVLCSKTLRVTPEHCLLWEFR